MNLRKLGAEVASGTPDFCKLFEALPGLYLILDIDLTIVAVNRAYAQATLIDPEAVLGRALFDVFPDNPQDTQADGVRNLQSSLSRVLLTRRADTMAVQKYDIRKPDGEFEERYWSPINTPVLGNDGTVRWIIHRVEDVTDLMRLKAHSKSQNQIARDLTRVVKELRSANSQLAQTLSDNDMLEREHVHLANIVESSGNAIVGITLEGTVTSWNRSAERLFGYCKSEIVGKSDTLLFSPDSLSREIEIVARVLNDEVISQYETVRVHKDGRHLNVSLTVSPIHDRRGSIIGASAIVRDITAEKRAEEELKKLHLDRLFLADLVQSTTDAVVARTNDGRIRNCNHAAELIFGYSAEEMVGQAGWFSSDIEAETAAVIERLQRGEPSIHYESRRPRKNGDDVHVFITASRIRNQEGYIVGTSETMRDITDQKRVEAQALALKNELAHIDRLSTMGQMSAAIAHELNQPLTAIGNYANAAMRFLERDPACPNEVQSARSAIGKATAQAMRAGSIIRSLREYVEKRDTSRSPECLNAVIREAVALGMVDLKCRRINLVLALDPSAPRAPIDKVQFQQVILNLMRNSAEAMVDADQRKLTIATAIDSASVLITVRDTGPGISADVRSRLFQPFVTSKADGMGIGLNVCQSIIEAHGGTIDAADASPGALFSIRLPLADDGLSLLT